MSIQAVPSSSSMYALINWPGEDSYSIISARKILSPQDELQAGTICKIKNHEQCPTRILAVGTETEMDNKLLDVIDEVRNEHSEMKKREESIQTQTYSEAWTKDTPKPPSPLQKDLVAPEPDKEWYMHSNTPQVDSKIRVAQTGLCSIRGELISGWHNA